MIAHAPKPSLPKLLLSSRLGLVSVPGASAPEGENEPLFDRTQARDLIRGLGRSLGLSSLPVAGETFPEGEAAPSIPALPHDEAVLRTLECLDVVWVDGEDVVAVFVIEERAGGWEGLRALADLLALHPKLKAPLYAVTLPSLEARLLAEVQRPAYRLLKKPLAEVLRLLDWDRLRTEVEQLGERVRYLKPEFLEGISDRIEAPPAE
jgi:hypothetical protein